MFLGWFPWIHFTPWDGGRGREDAFMRGDMRELGLGFGEPQSQGESPMNFLCKWKQGSPPLCVGFVPLEGKGWKMNVVVWLCPMEKVLLINYYPTLCQSLYVSPSPPFLMYLTCHQQPLASDWDLNLILNCNSEPIFSFFPLQFDSFLFQFSAVYSDWP